MVPACGSDASDPVAAAGSSGSAGSAGKAAGGGSGKGGNAQGGAASGAPGEAGSDAGGEGPSEAGSGGEGGDMGDAGAANTAGTGGTSGSGGTAGTGGTAGGSAGTAGTAGAGGSSGGSACGPTCGNAPYQCYDPIFAQRLLGTPTGTEAVEASLCPGVVLQIPNQGMSAMQVGRNTPFFFIGKQADSLTTFSVELNATIGILSKAAAGLSVVPPSFPVTVDPAWDATKKALISFMVGTTKTGATTPCNTKAGVVFAVTGHPEAVVKYDGNGSSTNTTATGWISLVTTGTVSAPEYVAVTATKASCVVGLEATTKLFQTGRTPVAINATTFTVSYEISN